MIGAVSLAVLASFLWAIGNHVDKFLINGIDGAGKSIKTLMVFSSLIAGLVFAPIWLIVSVLQGGVSMSWFSLVMMLLSSVVSVLALYFYFWALNQNDASIVVIMFQMIPVFSYILALIFFQEVLTLSQITGAVIIMLSAILISWNFGEKKAGGNRSKAFFWMMLSSLSYAIYYILFNAATRESPYSSCAFCYQIGLILVGAILIGRKSYRGSFLKAIKSNGKTYISLNVANETINLVAVFLVNYAATIIPVALTGIAGGLQGAFVFVLGALGTKFLPKYFKENLSKKIVLQKITCIILSVVGLAVMLS